MIIAIFGQHVVSVFAGRVLVTGADLVQKIRAPAMDLDGAMTLPIAEVAAGHANGRAALAFLASECRLRRQPVAGVNVSQSETFTQRGRFM